MDFASALGAAGREDGSAAILAFVGAGGKTGARLAAPDDEAALRGLMKLSAELDSEGAWSGTTIETADGSRKERAYERIG